jgi:CubicO group peptidase (beta-lactamase class C family)
MHLTLLFPVKTVLQRLLVCLAIACAVGISQANSKTGQQQPSQRAEAIARKFEAWLEKHQIHSGAIAVSYRGTPIATGGKSRGANTPAPVASLSKAVTAICTVNALISSNNPITLRLHDALPDLFSQFTVADRRLRDITVGQLISHNSGLGKGFPGGYLGGVKDFSKERKRWQFSKIAEHRLKNSPGSGYQYSNANYLLLGLVIEALTDTDYQTYCINSVLKPIGITNARLSNKRRILSSYGGWEISAADYLTFLDTYFKDNKVMGRTPEDISSKVKTAWGGYYGPGMLMRKVKSGYNFWHSGSWKWKNRWHDDQFGAYAAAYANGFSVSVNFGRGASPEARKALDKLLHKAAH